MTTVKALDKDKLNEFIRQTGSTVTAGFNCVISVLGDRLGLFRKLAELGSVSSQELADSLGLSERWIREWLHHQACVNQVEYNEITDSFSLSPEAEAVLVDEDHPAYLMGAYHSALSVFPAAEQLEESFRTGLGMTYDDHGANCACGMALCDKGLPRVSRTFPARPSISAAERRMWMFLECGPVAQCSCTEGILTSCTDLRRRLGVTVCHSPSP